MTNPRKVQGEIDKLLKKVQDGMEVYDEVNEKVEAAPDQASKVRVEAELKKEIKKLQRLRELVKGYIANSEVKDKKALEVARRNVEIKMEAFKITERETKTKAFSKEGLAAAAKADPNDPREKTCDWLRDAIADLGEKQEQLEFDVEAEQNSAEGGGKKKGANTKLDSLEERMSRVKLHIKRCEQLMRNVNRGDIEPSEVDDIQEEVEAFVEHALDLDFREENPEVYDMFDLPELDADTSDDEDDDGNDDDETTAAAKPQSTKPAAAAAAVSAAAPAPKAAGKKQPAAAGAPAVASPIQSRQNSALHDESSAVPRPGGKIVPGGTVAAAAVSKAPPAAVASPVGKQAAAAAATTTAVVAAAPASAPAAKPGSKLQLQDPTAPVGMGKGAKSTLSTASSSTPGSPSKGPGASSGSAFANNATPSRGESFMGTPAGSGMSGGGDLLNGGAGDDGSALLDDEDDALNDDTFGDDAMSAVGPGGNLADLASMTAKGGADPLGRTSTPQKPANVWAAKKQMAVSSSSAPSLPDYSAQAPAAQPKVKSAWSQPLSSLVTAADKRPPPASQMPTLGSEGASEDNINSVASSGNNNKLASTLTPVSNSKIGNTQSPSSSNAAAKGGDGNSVSSSTPQQNSNIGNSNNKSSSEDRSQQPAAPPLLVPQQVELTPASTARLLDMSVRNLPQPSDVERLKPYVPANPQPTPPYYPQKIPGCFSNPELFQRFEPDTLFFIFYYQQGTYQHYLAAKELKRNSYRFHKKFTTWFQRHDRPKSLNEEQEQGTYVYFDFESGWCQRIKNDFAFRYQYLENELV